MRPRNLCSGEPRRGAGEGVAVVGEPGLEGLHESVAPRWDAALTARPTLPLSPLQ